MRELERLKSAGVEYGETVLLGFSLAKQLAAVNKMQVALSAWSDAGCPGYDMTEEVEMARAALSGESHMMRWALLDIVAAIESRGK